MFFLLNSHEFRLETEVSSMIFVIPESFKVIFSSILFLFPPTLLPPQTIKLLIVLHGLTRRPKTLNHEGVRANRQHQNQLLEALRRRADELDTSVIIKIKVQEVFICRLVFLEFFL
jgi:hypothetical protein